MLGRRTKNMMKALGRAQQGAGVRYEGYAREGVEPVCEAGRDVQVEEIGSSLKDRDRERPKKRDLFDRIKNWIAESVPPSGATDCEEGGEEVSELSSVKSFPSIQEYAAPSIESEYSI
mmetsp:Transcript_59495/g.158329  ORF Transcript_59495/g.158329 Transcript_59495/m.158329 type:complete len:118 (+) Transcript_59495:141-494(+)